MIGRRELTVQLRALKADYPDDERIDALLAGVSSGADKVIPAPKPTPDHKTQWTPPPMAVTTARTIPAWVHATDIGVFDHHDIDQIQINLELRYMSFDMVKEPGREEELKMFFEALRASGTMGMPMLPNNVKPVFK